MTVDPPKTDALWLDQQPEPQSIRPRDDLIVGLMEARDCSYPDAEDYVEQIGELEAEKEIRARWTQ